MKYIVLFFSAVVSWSGSAFGSETSINVVSSIKPVHSLVSGVMKGVGEPKLLLKGANSPHSYSLKPSEANLLETANLVFWIGPGLETFLEKPIANIASRAQIVALSQSPDINLLAPRSGGTFDEHEGHEGHEGHAEHEDHEDHAENEEHEEHEEHAKNEEHEEHVNHDDHDHDDHHDEEHSDIDPHIWLDPGNGLAMVNEIANVLSAADPENSEIYRSNATEIAARLAELSGEVETILAPVRNKNFIVFHDAYQYFEDAFDFEVSGSLTVSAEVSPGAKRISEIRNRIQETNAVCVFAEPQFQSSILKVVGENVDVKIGELDPLGAGLVDGPDLYFSLIKELATSMHDCLATASTQ